MVKSQPHRISKNQASLPKRQQSRQKNRIGSLEVRAKARKHDDVVNSLMRYTLPLILSTRVHFDIE